MQPVKIKELIVMDESARTPKYMQVSNSIIRAIEQGKLIKGDQLPSLRQLSNELNIAFDTAKKAYDVLKKRNIVVAAQGKSNVVNATGPLPIFRIFLLFNKLGSHKRLIYDAFTEAFTELADIDLHVYNNDFQLFEHLLKTKSHGYTHYVIVPHLADDPAEVSGIIDRYLGGKHLVLLDKKMEGLHTLHATVHEDFENDIYHSLKEALGPLKRYKKINLVYSSESYYPPEIMNGFEKFCTNYSFEYGKYGSISKDMPLHKEEVFITLSDEDLCTLIQQLRLENLVIGKDVGIISYNETPLKEVLLDGITTISTDFRQMGLLAAQQVINNTTEQIAVPFRLTLRSSL